MGLNREGGLINFLSLKGGLIRGRELILEGPGLIEDVW